jgi:integrase
MAFGALAEEWQASRQHLAMRSQETTQFLLDSYVLPVLGRLPIAAISAADVERVLTAMTSRGLATATRRRALSVVRLVLDYGVRDRRLAVNVARAVALPRGATKREPQWLRAEQLGRLAMSVPELCRPVVLFLGLTGCRFSEMAALRVDDVIQTPHGLGVRAHRAAPRSKRTSVAVFGPTKTHQTRTVPVPAAIEGYIRRRVATGVSGDFLFPSPTGGVWTNTNFRARSRWTQTTQSAGLAGTTIHDLRHTAASLLIAAGADVKAVQVILGHATATMTMDLYGHLFSEAPWLAMERMPTIPMTADRPAIGPAPHDPSAMGV